MRCCISAASWFKPAIALMLAPSNGSSVDRLPSLNPVHSSPPQSPATTSVPAYTPEPPPATTAHSPPPSPYRPQRNTPSPHRTSPTPCPAASSQPPPHTDRKST